jgi:hypothetical protein
MDIILKKVARHLPKGSHKGRQAGHNDSTGRYVRQHMRTTSNKAKARKLHLENHPNDLQALINIK